MILEVKMVLKKQGMAPGGSWKVLDEVSCLHLLEVRQVSCCLVRFQIGQWGMVTGGRGIQVDSHQKSRLCW